MQNRIVRTLAAGVVALGALAACTAPGTAGTVNGKTISEKQVDELASAIKDNGGTVANRGSLVSLLQLNEVFAPLAQEAGFSDSDVATMVSSCSRGYAFVGSGKNVPEAVRNFCIVQLGAQTNKELLASANAAIADLDLTFSSRYGEVKDGKIVTPEYLQSVRKSK